jgi:lysophospholipid acyltransferase (LPLAT)-like uncharacterized protein
MSTESAKPPTARPRSSARVIPHQATWHGRLAAAAVFGLIRTVDATLRYTVSDPGDAIGRSGSGPVIFATWHNRLALSLRIYQRCFVPARPRRRMAAMVSASRDGGLLARILELFEVQPVRGSSSRRGHQALLEMVTWAEQGYDLAITPDGPRGPRHVVQDGVIAVAQLTGLPIVPVSSHVAWKWQARSWDRFQVPLPFARVRLGIGDLVTVPREAPPEERERLRQQLQTRLLELGGD